MHVRGHTLDSKKNRFVFRPAKIIAVGIINPANTGHCCVHVAFDNLTEEKYVDVVRVNSLEWISQVKSEKRAKEKTVTDHAGDARCLKDMLRASVICDTLSELLRSIAAIMALGTAGVVMVKQIKNRFNDGSCGYKDINYSVEFEGHICEIQLHLRAIVSIKQGAGSS